MTKFTYRGKGAWTFIQQIIDNHLADVAVCYEAQCAILNVDPRAMSVKALESVSNRPATVST